MELQFKIIEKLLKMLALTIAIGKTFCLFFEHYVDYDFKDNNNDFRKKIAKDFTISKIYSQLP